ncbi:hypothetical protein [Curtobacterium sp. RRHDQ10]|uniref:hypothetical protein n=1 Tax=Curtobacterium phyllosphaerae TaxID=3413379 RepID=UPI003BF12489
MTNSRTTTSGQGHRRYPREIAASVTLGAAARALARPSGGPLVSGECVAITTACTALRTRLALVADVGRPVGAASDVQLVTWVLPDALTGAGTAPSAMVLRTAGDRCVAAWQRWATSGGRAADDPGGVAGALAVAAWCSWGTRRCPEALTRASYALDIDPTDPLALLVQRWCRLGRRPAWTAVEPD